MKHTKVTTKWFSAEVNGLKTAQRQAVDKGLWDAGEYILQEANKTVPHDEGTLERSGSMDSESTKEKTTVSVFYDTPYAPRLHEHPEYNFQNGRRGKWLELALKENLKKVQDFLVMNIKLAYRKVGKGK